MHKVAALLFLLIIIPAYTQTINYQGDKYVLFRLENKENNSVLNTSIHWKLENPVSEFTLKGKAPTKYSIRLKNDTIALLYRHDDKKLILHDTISHSGWPLRRINGKEIISEFKITDFDCDGNEDLLCCAASNINGNQWTLIYLNDQKQRKLVKLMNNADKTDIWDNPHYNKKKKLIECELFSGVFGFQSTYTFRLENHIALPVYKEERNYTSVDAKTGEGEVIQEFTGDSGIWKLKE